MATIKRILSRVFMANIFNREVKKTFSLKSVLLAPWLGVKFTFEPTGSATYTRPSRHVADKFRICIGGELACKIANIPSTIDIKKHPVKDFVRDSACALRGLFYHELGHLIYTDMSDKTIREYPKAEYRGFIHRVWNTLEDAAMEKGMENTYPFTKHYFLFIKKNLFLVDADSYSDAGDMPSFLNFLLLKLRLGKSFTGTNKLWDDNKTYMVSTVKDILTTANATERIHKSVAFAEWLIENSGMDCKDMDSPMDAPPSSAGSPAGSHSPKELEVTDTPELEDGDPIAKEAEDTEDTDETYNPDDDLLINDCPELTDAFNDVLNSGDDQHQFISARDYFVPHHDVDMKIADMLNRVNPLALSVSRSFKVYKSRIKPRMTGGFPSGKLDVRKAMQNSLVKGCDVNVFKKKVCNGVAADPMIQLLIDNSGSMHGNKSRVCTEAALALAQACELSKVPVAISAFTEGNGFSWTMELKTFDEKLKTALPYLGIIHSDLWHNYEYTEVPVFCNNIDEVNLYYVGKKLERERHKDKLLIVISDGETCGSTEALRKVIANISRAHIGVIGLGIQSTAVANAYPVYKLFDTKESLEALPDFLANVLYNFSKGGVK